VCVSLSMEHSSFFFAKINISHLPTSQTQNGSSNSSKNFMSTVLICAIFLYQN